MKMFQRFVFCDQIAQGREFFRIRIIVREILCISWGKSERRIIVFIYSFYWFYVKDSPFFMKSIRFTWMMPFLSHFSQFCQISL